MLRKFAGIVLGVCAGASTLLAQSTWTPQEDIDKMSRGSNVEQHTASLGWVFHPITTSTEVTAFFGTLASDDAIGANVKLMYFTHDSYGEWTSYGWEDGDTDAAIAWIRLQHGNNALSRDTDLNTYPVVTTTPVAPTQMKRGIFVTDPNADIFDTMSAEAASTTIAWLVEAGYAASPKLAELLITEYEGGPKVLNDLMGFLSNQAEYTLFPLKTTTATTGALAWPCSCATVTTFTPSTTGPGTPTLVPSTPSKPNPSPTMGGCIYHYMRLIGTSTTATTGREWYCPSCATPASAPFNVYEYTDVIDPGCGTPIPTPAPNEEWHLYH